MKTLIDVRAFCFRLQDEPLELEKTRRKCIQARECLGHHLQTDITKNEMIREAQDKIDKDYTLKITKKIFGILGGILG